MIRLYKIVLLLAFVSLFSNAKAAHLNSTGFQSSSAITALPSASFSFNQNDYATLPTVTGYVNYAVNNNLMVFIDHTYSTYIGTAYSYTVKIELKTWDANKALSTQIVELPVEYDPNANPGVSYKDRSVFNFTGAHKIEVKVLDIKNNITNTWGVSNPEDNFIVKANIDIERIYNFNPTNVTTTSKVAANLNSNSADDELTISWPSITGAEEYDLEWTYLDDYDAANVSTPKALSALDWQFRSNATRITTSQTSYKLSLIYERGYIVFRVRGVGHNQTTPSILIFGDWNVADNGNMSSLAAGSYYRVLSHNNALNWQYSSVFAEEGKKKEVVGYYDGSLRGRQTVTKTNSDNTAIVGESIYDQVGRKTIDILPVPMQSPAIDYYPNLNLNMTGNKYGWTDFDTDVQPCSASTGGMLNTAGASQYYSTNNPNKTGNNAYIPDAQNYPFSQIEYEPDNTGRIRRQGGVGVNHQLNSGHETKYYYGQPTQIELDRLFGNEVGYASHYKKNMVVDPNGQISISYLDQEGRVIATALSGQKPSNVAQLTSYPTSPTVLNADLIPTIKGSSVSKQNPISLDYTSLEYNTQLLVSEPGDYTFNYDVAKESFTFNCNGNTVCFDCSYDLEITITNECGVILYTDKANIGSPVPDLTCSNVMVFHSAGKTFPFTVNLGVGKYQVTKTLKINQSAYEYYLTKYLDGSVNTCLTPFSQFLNEEKGKLDYSGCELTCEQCAASLGTKDEFVLNGHGSESDWQAEYDKCMAPCKGTSLCEQTLHMMTEDMKPGGQYAQWFDATTEQMDVSLYPLSILNPANILPDLNKPITDADGAFWKNPKVEIKNVNGTFSTNTGYFEEDGITRSTIEVVKLIDGSLFPKADAYFTVGDRTYCYPEKLQNVRDFISFFKSSWASSLVYYHPEYCYNKWCVLNISSNFNSYSKTSEEFDATVNDINTYADAVTAGYTSGLNNLANVDPFFNLAANGTSYKTAMTNKLANWDGTGKDAQKVSTITARASQWYGTNIPVGTDVWGSGTIAEQDKAWNTYKSFYLSYKQQLMKQSADAWVTNSTNCGRGYNGCIGEGNFNPFPAMTVAALNGTTDPCAISTYLYYKNKTRRFDITASQAATIDQEKARFNRSYYEQACPFDLDFGLMLDNMTITGKLGIAHPMYEDAGYTPELHKILIGNPPVLPSTFASCSWLPFGISTNVLTVNINTGTGNFSCPGMTNTFEMTLKNGGAWSSVQSIKKFKFIGTQPLTGLSLFTCNAIIGGQEFEVEGKSCLPFGSCTFGDDCQNTDYATSLQALLSSLAQNSQLTSVSQVDLETSYTNLVNRHIRANVAGSNNNLRYVYSSSSPATMRIFQNGAAPSGNDINVIFNAYSPVTFTAANLGSIKYFTDLKYLDANVNTTFTVKGWYLNTGNWVSVLITGSVSRGVLATCSEPVPMVCDNIEYRATLDFEDFLKYVANTHPTLDLDLRNNTKYTGLLESYVGKGNATLMAPNYQNHSITTSIKLTDPSTGAIISNCAITLERKSQMLINLNDPSIGFQNIVDFGMLRADMKTYQSGGAKFFTAVVKFQNGKTEEIKGSVSCIPLYRCDKCEPEVVFFTNEDTCDEYKYYVQEVAKFNLNYPGGDATLIPYSDTFPCGCVNNYLAYLKMLQFNVDLEYNPPIFPTQMAVLSLTQFQAIGCQLTKKYECCVASNGQFNNLDKRAVFLQALAAQINAMYGGANPPTWWTGPFVLDPNQFDCNTNLSCWCPGKYAEYLARWVNYNNAYNPWPGPPPFMPISYTEFVKRGCDGGDCWWQYNYYNKIYTARGGTPEAYNKNVNCACYTRAARSITTVNPPSLITYCKKISTFVSFNPYQNANFNDPIKQGKLNFGYRTYFSRGFSNCTPEYYPQSDYINGCSKWLDDIAYRNAEIRYQDYLKQQTELFHKGYMDKCMGALETFTMQYPIRDYHYTLYFYDQAGSLVRTVPPAGVKIVSDANDLASIFADRVNDERTFYTTHILNTVYEYNSLNQLVKQSVPDHDKMDKWYVSVNNGVPAGFEATDIHFSNPNLGYMIGNINVSGANGDAIILRTVDGGVNWERVNDIRTNDLTKIAMVNATIGYAIGKGGLFLKTSDGGVNWKIVPNNNAFNNDLNDLVVRQNGANYEGVVGGNAGFSKYFVDNGTTFTWTNKTLPAGTTTYNVLSVAFKETSTGVGYAVIDLNGTSKLLSCATFTGLWAENILATKTRAADLNCIFMRTTTIGFAAGVDGTLLKTTDAGVNWAMVPTAKNFEFKKLYFNTDLIGMALAADGKLYKTSNGGLSWAQASAIGTYRDFQFYNASTGAGYAVGNAGLFARLTVNASTTKVEKIAYPQSITANLTTIYAQSTGVDGIVAGENGSIYRLVNASTNIFFDDITTATVAGKNFTKSYLYTTNLVGALMTSDGLLWRVNINGPATNYTGVFNNISGAVTNFADLTAVNTTLYCLSNTSGATTVKVYSATNPTTPIVTLTPTIQSGDGQLKGIAAIAVNNILLAGNAGTLYKYNASWTYNSKKTAPHSLTAVYAASGLNNVVVAGTDGLLMISTDNAANFSTVKTGTVNRFNAIRSNTTNLYWIAANAGQVLKVDPANVATLYNGFSGENVTDIALLSTTDMVATTNNAKATIYRSMNTGVTWFPITAGATPSLTMEFKAARLLGNEVLFTGTEGHILGYNHLSSSWVLKSKYTHILNDVHFNANGEGMAVGNTGVTLKATNKGYTWYYNGQIAKTGVTFSNLNKVFVDNAGVASVVGTAAFAKTMNTNSSNAVDITLPGVIATANLKAVTQSDAGTWLIAGGYQVFRKLKGASAYAAIHTGATTEVFNDIESDGNYAYLVGNSKLVKRSININDVSPSFSTIAISGTVPASDFAEIEMYDRSKAYIAGSAGVVLKTVDWGASWIQKFSNTGSTNTSSALNALAINKRDHLVFAGAANYSREVIDQADFASSVFYYDRLGRNVVSQNTKQYNKATKAYSYTLYDALGRLTEVGEKANNTSIETTYIAKQIDDAQLNSWINAGANSTRTEVTSTYYDVQFSGVSSTVITQTNLRKRIASMSYEDVYDANPNTYEHASHYTYDVHGNVPHLVQDIPALAGMGQQYKHIYYDFDLISGKVNQLDYNPGNLDEYHHKYTYDADNRITEVYTSRDAKTWDRDATYEYYKHGPLARTELGDLKVQGHDYFYTIQGWIKGVNSNSMNATRDPGRDGDFTLGGNTHSAVAKDAYGYSLGYFEGDFTPIGALTSTQKAVAQTAGSDMMAARTDLWNGNISSMVTCLPKAADYNTSKTITAEAFGNAYKYDQLNRLASSRTFTNLDYTNNAWQSGGGTNPTALAADYTYDAMGNILTQKRNGAGIAGLPQALDDLSYNYQTNANGLMSNRLYMVDDAVSSTNYTDDIDDQGTFNNTVGTINTANNYGYDELGNLVRDDQEGIANIEWTVYGKIKKVTRTAAGKNAGKAELEFGYDASGNRLWKKVTPYTAGVAGSVKIYYYLRDAQGDEMNRYSQYTHNTNGLTYESQEHAIYCSSRLGIDNSRQVLYTNGAAVTNSSTINSRQLGMKSYELSNHLGNVLVTVTDKKVYKWSGSAIYFEAELTSITDYYPFGSAITSRLYSIGAYRFGFNGKEKDNDYFEGAYAFEARIFDSRLGIFQSLDPRMREYGWQSPYAYFKNSPISVLDIAGMGGPLEDQEGNETGCTSSSDCSTTNDCGTIQSQEALDAPVSNCTAVQTCQDASQNISNSNINGIELTYTNATPPVDAFRFDFNFWDYDACSSNDDLFKSEIYIQTRNIKIGNTTWEVPSLYTTASNTIESGAIGTSLTTQISTDAAGQVSVSGVISITIAGGQSSTTTGVGASVSGEMGISKNKGVKAEVSASYSETVTKSGGSKTIIFSYKAVYDANHKITSFTIVALTPGITQNGAVATLEHVETDRGAVWDEDDSEVYMNWSIVKTK